MSGNQVARRINSFGVIDTMADVMLDKGVPEHIRSDNGAEMTAKIVRKLVRKARSKDALHCAWKRLSALDHHARRAGFG